MNRHPTATFKIAREDGRDLIRFYCDLSGALVCTAPAPPGPDGALSAWEAEGRGHFSRCRRCGRWACDAMYNPDTLMCVDCSPWEEQPAFCPQCGQRVDDDETFCRRCHARLRYGDEVDACESTD